MQFRNRLWYLSDQESITNAVNDLTIKEINKLFKEADYVIQATLSLKKYNYDLDKIADAMEKFTEKFIYNER